LTSAAMALLLSIYIYIHICRDGVKAWYPWLNMYIYHPFLVNRSTRSPTPRPPLHPSVCGAAVFLLPCLCVFCVGPLCGPPLRWWVFCGVCVGPLWVGSSPVVFPFLVASVPRLASRSRSRSRSYIPPFLINRCTRSHTFHPPLRPSVCAAAVDDDMLTPTGYPPPQHSSRHGTQHTQHTASTAATPRYPQGRRQTPADAPTPLKRSMLTPFGGTRHRVGAKARERWFTRSDFLPPLLPPTRPAEPERLSRARFSLESYKLKTPGQRG